MYNDNENDQFDEDEIKLLIEGLLTEKERHMQEKFAQKIGRIKDIRTAELISVLLYTDDTFIRNICIELFIALGAEAVPVLKTKLLDKDRNIRKFALDALKHIKGEYSCKIALNALDDGDDNVVEAALEVIAQQQYRTAEDKLYKILNKTSSIWIINSLLRTFESLETKDYNYEIKEKIFNMNITDIEKNILVNSYVRILGSIGSEEDIDLIINQYQRDFIIEPSNLISALSKLLLKTDLSKLSEEVKVELEKIFKENFSYHSSDEILILVAALVKLQLDFFLEKIEEIYDYNKEMELFAEGFFEIVEKLLDINKYYINRMLRSKEPELVLMGLKLIYNKQIPGFKSIVEEFCYSMDTEIRVKAIGIIMDIELYRNEVLLECLGYCKENEEGQIEKLKDTATEALDKDEVED